MKSKTLPPSQDDRMSTLVVLHWHKESKSIDAGETKIGQLQSLSISTPLHLFV